MVALTVKDPIINYCRGGEGRGRGGGGEGRGGGGGGALENFGCVVKIFT